MKILAVNAAAMIQEAFRALDPEVQEEYVREAMEDAIADSHYPIDTWAMWLNVTTDNLCKIYPPLAKNGSRNVSRGDMRAIQRCLRDLLPEYEERGLKAGR